MRKQLDGLDSPGDKVAKLKTFATVGNSFQTLIGKLKTESKDVSKLMEHLNAQRSDFEAQYMPNGSLEDIPEADRNPIRELRDKFKDVGNSISDLSNQLTQVGQSITSLENRFVYLQNQLANVVADKKRIRGIR